MLILTFLTFSLSCVSAATISTRQATSLPSVNLGYSTCQATNVSNGIATYKNIRYAAPPVGNLRWAMAQPPLQENATNTGSPASNGTNGCTLAEDCLFLDVWAPINATGRLPVIVWVHGAHLRE